MSLISELKRRNVVRVILAYAVASYLLVEIMELATGAFEAPAWVLKVFITVVILGVVPVVIFSWIYEITPEGIKRETTNRPEHPASTARKLDIAVMVMLTVAIGLFVQDRFGGEEQELSPPVKITKTTQALAQIREGPPIVAVLPFASASLGGDGEFFANGVHDDLLTQLAKLQSIRVISRTSVLEYRSTAKNMRQIGQELGADAILEGGVQTAGARLRINVQLIDAHTDKHLWAETYNRELSTASIFDVQAEIARAISLALNAALTDQDTAQLKLIPTENMGAYRAFRRAMEIRDTVRSMSDPAYLEALEDAVALDPTFIRAWAELAGVLAFKTTGSRNPDPELTKRAEQTLERIRAVAPGSAEYLIAQAYYIYYVLRDNDRAHDVASQALARNPSDVRLLELKSWIERRQGDFDARLESIRSLVRLDPRNPAWTQDLVSVLLVSHRYDDAMDEVRKASSGNYALAAARELLLLQQHGDFERWLESIKALGEDYGEGESLEFVGGATRAGGDLWIAYIANRDYSYAAQVFLGEIDVQKLEATPRIPNEVRLAMFTYWLMNEPATLQQFLTYTRGSLEKALDASGDFPVPMNYLSMALVTAAEGDGEESKRLLRRWERLVATDWTRRALQKDESCRIFGMAEATTAAVECIRTGLREPSYVMPFLEPYLPFYDSMRDEPEFVDLLADLDDAENDP